MGTTYQLDWHRVAAQIVTNEINLHRTTVEQWADHAQFRLVTRLKGYVLSDHVSTEHKVVWREVPASWWQHTKMVHFPTLSRWLRRPPRLVREEAVVVLDTTATFPQARVAYPDELGPVFFHQESRVSYR